MMSTFNFNGMRMLSIAINTLIDHEKRT